MTIVQTILTQDLADKLVLIDAKPDKLRGEMLNLQHAATFLPRTKIVASIDYFVTVKSDLCIVTTGVHQNPGESRLNLLQRNVALFSKIVTLLAKYLPDSILLIVSNPVNVLIYVSWKLFGFPSNRVIGSGTNLDSSRFRFLIADHLDMNAQEVRNSQFPMDSMSRSTPVPSCFDDETPEESSWTMYFEDFSNDHDNGNISISCCSSDINHQTSSLVPGRHVLGKTIKKNRLSFKKRKANGSSAGFVDDDLEDTASSPVNSPKMCNMEKQFGKSLKMKDVMDMSQKEKASGSPGEMVDGNVGGEDEETQLKKKGLCLVPLSMVLQYLG